MADTSLVNTIMFNFVQYLGQKLIRDVPTDDATRAGLVRAGKLQDDPTDAIINILIHPGDQDWRHEIAKASDNGTLTPPATYIMGFGDAPDVFWWYRFRVELKMSFDNENERILAQTKANVVLSRLKAYLWQAPLPKTWDSFGNFAHRLELNSAYVSEGGGEGTFIWNGEVKFSVLVEESPRRFTAG